MDQHPSTTNSGFSGQQTSPGLSTSQLQSNSAYASPTSTPQSSQLLPLEPKWTKYLGIFQIVWGVLSIPIGLISLFSGMSYMKAAETAEKYLIDNSPETARIALGHYSKASRLQAIFWMVYLGIFALFFMIYFAFIIIFVVAGAASSM